MAPRRYGSNFRSVIFNQISQIDILNTSYETAHKRML